MPHSLTDLAGTTAAPLEEVALAIASEFRTVDVAGARANLDRLAEGMEDLVGRPPEERAQGLLHRLVEDRGLTATSCGCPDGRQLPRDLHWLCPHVVGATMLGHLIERFISRGAVGEAIRAAELRLLFPMAADTRDRHEIELRRLRARLN